MKPKLCLLHHHHTASLFRILRNKNLHIAAGSKKTLLLFKILHLIEPSTLLATLYTDEEIGNSKYCFNSDIRESIYTYRKGFLGVVSLISRLCMDFSLSDASPETLIIYGVHPFYLPVIFFRFFRRQRFILDIEDLPYPPRLFLQSHSRPLKTLSVWLSYKLSLFLLCNSSRKCITASNSIAESLPKSLQSTSIPFGFSSPISNRRDRLRSISAKWSSPFSNHNPLVVHYGGSIIPQTGSLVAAELLKSLQSSDIYVHFLVTGFGDFTVFNNICSTTNLAISIYPELATEELESLKLKAHCGLSLKDDSTPIGKLTFPSKVFDIVDSGQFLISAPHTAVSTHLSGVDKIMLTTLDVKSLSESIHTVYASDQETMAGRIESSYKWMHENYSNLRISERLSEHLSYNHN